MPSGRAHRAGAWEPVGLRRVAGFPIFRFSPPRPPGPRWRPLGGGRTPERWRDELSRGATKVLTATDAACATVTSRVLQDLRVEEPGHFEATPGGVAEISF